MLVDIDPYGAVELGGEAGDDVPQVARAQRPGGLGHLDGGAVDCDVQVLVGVYPGKDARQHDRHLRLRAPHNVTA
ncbi:hypothetical protein [Georgenia sp. AZ-5]|uniref:hypothetical protein n=1 Tax=Georgenia sp. AZ-5 TaxID=3367526 RepID=UPI0037553F6E